ncbi:MAG: hypothetical protein IJE89_05055 [Bacilli bacterium]|nr:hypothetical protein [Bacilli bacterium]
MFYNDDLRQNGGFGYGDNIDININNTNTNQNVNMNMNENFDGGFDMGMTTGPVMEPGRERVVQRNIVHEVKHVCPINTRIINNHIFRHTYQPRYTCCEENVVTNQQCGSCCQFR